MAVFKLVVSDPATRKSLKIELDQSKAVGLVGKKIGEQIDADGIGLSGYTLQITGGTDKDGFPMHPSVRGAVKKKIILSSAPGFHPTMKGLRKRKTVRGDTISDDIVQINTKIVKAGAKPFSEMLPKREEKKPEVKEEAKVEPQPEPKVETKPQPEVKAAPKPEAKPAEAKQEEKKEDGGGKGN